MYLEHTALPYEIFIMKNYVWQKFWRLLVLEEAERAFPPSIKSWVRRVKCLCDCWTIKIYFCTTLCRKIQSCWCLQKEKVTKLWMCNHPMYQARNSLKDRCKNHNNKNYHNYWWRWITYDPKRETFEWFYEDMKAWWKKWLSIDRIDNNWNYCKENCRWATQKEQMRNFRGNVVYNWKCVSEWKEIWWVTDDIARYKINKLLGRKYK